MIINVIGLIAIFVSGALMWPFVQNGIFSWDGFPMTIGILLLLLGHDLFWERR